MRRLAKDTPGPSAIALDDAHVYFTNVGDGTVKSGPKDGAPPAAFA